MSESYSDPVIGRTRAIALALLGDALPVLSAQPAGAVVSVSQVVSAQSAEAAVGSVAHLSEVGLGGEGDERLDSMRATATTEAPPACTVEFRHTAIGISEGLYAVLFFEFEGCSSLQDPYIVLGNTPFPGTEFGVDYTVDPDTVDVNDTDGTEAWGFHAFEDEIPESGEGAWVFVTAMSSGVTLVGPDTAIIYIDDDDDPSNTVPNNPQNLSGTPGDRHVTLSWTPPSNDGGSAIRRYEYRHAVATDTFPTNWRTAPGGADARSVTVSNLNNGTTHKLEVRAVNGIGLGTAAETTATPSAGGGGTPSLRWATSNAAAPPGDLLSVTGTILDDDLPVLSISAVDQTVPEGTDARFRLARVGDLSVTLSMPVTVRESGDFLVGTLPEAVDFEAGAAEAILALPTEDDPLDESDGTVEVTMASNDEYEIPGSPTARLLVTDNDQTPAVIITGAEVAENAGEITLPVTLRGASAYEVSVDWMTADLTARAGDDYGAASGRITLVPGETTGEVRVAVVDDLLPEDPEEFAVTLSGPVNAVLEVGAATVTITDNDEAVAQAWLSRFGRTVATRTCESTSWTGCRFGGSEVMAAATCHSRLPQARTGPGSR